MITSQLLGKTISNAEVQGITQFGIWILVYDKEYFLSYDQFPWFKDAKIKEILEVKEQGTNHLYWPLLDVDLSLNILKHPERFPLIAK